MPFTRADPCVIIGAVHSPMNGENARAGRGGEKALERLRLIVAEGLCHRCGSCSGICPAGVISPGPDYYPVWDPGDPRCTGCGLCARVCPGAAFSFPEHSKALFGPAADFRGAHGVVAAAFLGYALDPEARRRSTSGGVATALALHLLERGKAGGVFAAVPDAAQPWKPRAIVARTRAEALAGANSKYPACSMNHLFRDIRDESGPFAHVGLPCHVHGLRAMAALDRRVAGKVAVSIGLVCHSCLDHAALGEMLDCYRVREGDLASVRYREGKLPGYICAVMNSGERAYLPYPSLGPDRYRPNAKECLTLFFKLFSPPRCRLCVDSMAEFADIALGDPWYKGWEAEGKLREGYTLVIARTKAGLETLEGARRDGAVALEPFPAEKIPLVQHAMARAKRRRGFYFARKRREEGRPAPEYGFSPAFTRMERIRTGLHALTYAAADRPALRRSIYRFLLSRAGRPVVGALFFRRHVIQPLVEKARRGGVGGGERAGAAAGK